MGELLQATTLVMGTIIIYAALPPTMTTLYAYYDTDFRDVTLWTVAQRARQLTKEGERGRERDWSKYNVLFVGTSKTSDHNDLRSFTSVMSPDGAQRHRDEAAAIWSGVPASTIAARRRALASDAYRAIEPRIRHVRSHSELVGNVPRWMRFRTVQMARLAIHEIVKPTLGRMKAAFATPLIVGPVIGIAVSTAASLVVSISTDLRPNLLDYYGGGITIASAVTLAIAGLRFNWEPVRMLMAGIPEASPPDRHGGTWRREIRSRLINAMPLFLLVQACAVVLVVYYGLYLWPLEHITYPMLGRIAETQGSESDVQSTLVLAVALAFITWLAHRAMRRAIQLWRIPVVLRDRIGAVGRSLLLFAFVPVTAAVLLTTIMGDDSRLVHVVVNGGAVSFAILVVISLMLIAAAPIVEWYSWRRLRKRARQVGLVLKLVPAPIVVIFWLLLATVSGTLMDARYGVGQSGDDIAALPSRGVAVFACLFLVGMVHGAVQRRRREAEKERLELALLACHGRSRFRRSHPST